MLLMYKQHSFDGFKRDPFVALPESSFFFSPLMGFLGVFHSPN